MKSTSKSIWSVVAGIIVIVLLSVLTDFILESTGILTPVGVRMAPRMLGLALFYRTLYNIIGAYITARLAPQKPLKHAVILGCIGIVLGTAGAIAGWDLADHWYPIMIVVLALPSCYLGGKLFTK